MRWGKAVLVFQAIITLIIGLVFFAQLTKIGGTEVTELTNKFTENQPTTEEVSTSLDKIRTRYTIASYVLLIAGLTEIIIILRLFS